MTVSIVARDSGRFLDLIEAKKILSYKDLDEIGIHRNVPHLLEQEGVIQSLSKGIYVRSDESSQWTHYWAMSKRCEEAVFCLYSALVIHGITTQHAHSVWCELPRGTRRPAMGNIDMEIVTTTPWLHTIGVKTVRLDKVPVQVTSIERTVVDCFRLRRIVGMEVALEALKEAMGGHLVQTEDLEKMAKKMKIFSVMKPYIQAFS